MRSQYGAYARPRAIACSMPALHMEESLARALSGDKRLVARIMIGQQQICRVGVGARNDDRGHAHDIGRETRSHQLVDGFRRRHQYLAAEVSALFRRRQLIFKVHGSRARADQRLGQFERIEVAAKARLGVGNDGSQPVDVGFAFHVVNLIGAQQRIVDALDHFRYRIDRVEALIRIHLAGGIGVAGHLPSRAVDGFQARLHGLDGLIAGHAPQARHHRFAMQQPPELFGSQPRQ